VEGVVVKCGSPVSFLGDVSPAEGRVVEGECAGLEIAGRVFVFPSGKGSTVGSYSVYGLRYHGRAPLAMVTERPDPVVLVGAVMADIPVVYGIPNELLRDGDKVRVRGSEGLVEIPGVKTIDVATACLWDGTHILLLRRRDDAPSFPGRWSAVSGIVEEGETPLETAIREVREETGISLNPADMIREGTPVMVRERDVIWRVHPFLFKAAGQEVILDWENADFRWVSVEDLSGMPLVPMLLDVVRGLTGSRQPPSQASGTRSP
jgi:hypothetical protein